MERNCKYCGKIFEYTNSKKVFCSIGCGKRYRRGCKPTLMRQGNRFSTDDAYIKRVNSKYSKFEYIGKTSNNLSDGYMYLECSDCGFIFKHSGQNLRPSSRKPIECPNCRDILNKAKNKEAKLNKLQKAHRKQDIFWSKEFVQISWNICPSCGELSPGKKFCSEKCSQKYFCRSRQNSKYKYTRYSLKYLARRDNDVCYLCGGLIDWNDYFVNDKGVTVYGDLYPSRDHIVPKSNGGSDEIDNLKLAHRICNSIRGNFELMFDEIKELEKLNSIVARMDEPRKLLTEGLVDNAAFMIHQLSVLQDSIREHGVVDKYQHGENQSGMKQSVEMATYLQLQKSYSVTIRGLEGMLPKESKSTQSDELLEFLSNR